MARIIITGILITLIYSWEEIKHISARLFGFLSGRKEYPHKIYLDKIVADTLLLVTIPVTIFLYYGTNAPLLTKLLWSGFQLAVLFIILKLVHLIQKKTDIRPLVQTFGSAFSVWPGQNNLLPGAITLASFDRYEFVSKFIFRLAAVSGFGIVGIYLTDNFNPEIFSDAYSLLIFVLLACLVIWITISHLEKFLEYSRLNLSAAFRIFAGIILGALLLIFHF